MLERVTLRAPRLRAAAFSTTSLLALLIAGSSAFAQAPSAPAKSCAGDNGGLTLPSGFCATVFADKDVRVMLSDPNKDSTKRAMAGAYKYFMKKVKRGRMKPEPASYTLR